MIWFEAVLAAVLAMAGDQLSKAAVLARRPVPATDVRRPFISICCVLNTRGAMAPFLGVPALVALWIAAVLMAAVVLTYAVNGHDVLIPIGVGLVARVEIFEVGGITAVEKRRAGESCVRVLARHVPHPDIGRAAGRRAPEFNSVPAD